MSFPEEMVTEYESYQYSQYHINKDNNKDVKGVKNRKELGSQYHKSKGQ